MPWIRILGVSLLFLLLVSWHREPAYEWETACMYIRDVYSCEGVPRPKIVYEKMRYGLRGYYKGGDTIYVSSELPVYQTSVTTFHEMVHYLQFHVGGLMIPNYWRFICAAEDEAFMITDIYRATLGLEPDWPTWWENYPPCWESYAPDGYAEAHGFWYIIIEIF